MQQQTGGHTLKAFDEDLDRLRALISEMGGLAEHAIREAMRCLVQRDLEGAARIVEEDPKLDALEIETEQRVVQLIALRAPMAGDLRDAVAALKISLVFPYSTSSPRWKKAVRCDTRAACCMLCVTMAIA